MANFMQKKTFFCDILFEFLYTEFLLKRYTLKGKNFLPRKSKFFSFRVDPFSERNQNNFDEVAATKRIYHSPHTAL